MLLLLDVPPPATTPTFAAYFTGIDGCITAIATAILAGLTIVIAVYAYKAYKASNASLEESKRVNLDNTKFNNKQAVENTIFKMLEYHTANYREMYFLFPKEDKRVYGREAFECMYIQLKKEYRDYKAANAKKADLEIIGEAFSALYLSHSQIGAYYKNLYLLIKYIDQATEITSKDVYISILKAQLSRYEILLLPYDCVWIEGDKDAKDEFTTLVGKYELLTALERDALIERKSHEAIFKSKKLIK